MPPPRRPPGGPPGARPGEPGPTDRRAHRPPGHAIEIAQRGRPRRCRRGDRARRRRHRERGGQRHCSARPGPRPLGPCPPSRGAGRLGERVRPVAGHPHDPIDATNLLIDLLDEYRRRPGPGGDRADGLRERWGVFTAGMGWTATWSPPWRRNAAKGRKVTASPLHPRRGARDAGQRAPGSDADAAPARPRADCRRAFRVRLELQPVDLRQHATRCAPTPTPRSRRVSACSARPA